MRAKLLRLAALAGIWGVGLRLAPTVPDALHYPLMHEPAQLCETLTCMKDLGIAVFDLELIRLNADLRASDHLTALEVGQRLGAQVVNVIGDDSDPTRLAASCAALCDAAAPFGLICDIEPMPRSAVPDVASAHRVLPQVQRRNIGVLIDALHFGRSTSTLADVQALPREWLHFDQVCDGTLSGLGAKA